MECEAWELSLPLGNDIVNRLGDALSVVIETKVTEHHGGGEDHGGGVGLVLALDIETDVSATGLEDGVLAAHVGTGDDTGTTDESGTDVGKDRTVKVRHDEDIELLGTADSLHGGVVDDHVVDRELRVLLGDIVEGLAEETIGKLHDVSLVDAGDLLAVVGSGEGEGELGDALGLHTGDDLEGLDNAGNGLVLEAGVFTLGVLADDAHIDVLVAGLVTGHVLDHDNGRVNVELLTESNVEGLVTGALQGSVEDTWRAR